MYIKWLSMWLNICVFIIVNYGQFIQEHDKNYSKNSLFATIIPRESHPSDNIKAYHHAKSIEDSNNRLFKTKACHWALYTLSNILKHALAL